MRTPDNVRIGSFIAIAFGWAWGWWLLSILLLHTEAGSPLPEATTFLGTCSPAVAAWLIWWRESTAREAWRTVGRCLRPSGPVTAWLVASVAVVAVIASASGAQRLWGSPVPASPALYLILPQLIVMLIVGGGQEEIGWRGWLHPAVRTRAGRWQTPLVVGAIWFCWHLPLWWTPGSIQTYLPMPTFAMMTIGLSLIMARALESTRGRPAVAIWLHALNNLAATWLVFVTPVAGASQIGSWVMGGAYLVAGALVMLIPRATTSHQHDSDAPGGIVAVEIDPR